jgi:hypothetical protein
MIGVLNEKRCKKEIMKCYFQLYFDVDDTNYDYKLNKYIEDKLDYLMDPNIIYEYNEFISKKLEDKYKEAIEAELEIYNKNGYKKMGRYKLYCKERN